MTLTPVLWVSVEAKPALDFDAHHILAACSYGRTRASGSEQPIEIQNSDLHHSVGRAGVVS